jgi:hypothetical protein
MKISSNLLKSLGIHPYLMTSLLDALMKCGDVQSAELMFRTVTKRPVEMYCAMMKGNSHHSATLFSMNTIFTLSAGYVKNNEASKAIDLFHEIKNPDEVTQILVLDACAQLQTDAMLTLVGKISSNVCLSDASNPHLVTSLLDALMMCGDVKSAESLFNTLKKKALEMYGAMIKGIRCSMICDRNALFRIRQE